MTCAETNNTQIINYEEIYSGHPRAPKISRNKIRMVKDLNELNSSLYTRKVLSEELNIGRDTVGAIINGKYDDESILKRINSPSFKSLIAVSKSEIKYFENTSQATEFVQKYGTGEKRPKEGTKRSSIRDEIRKAANGTRDNAYGYYWIGCRN